MIISPDAELLTEDGTYLWTPERCNEAWRVSKEKFAVLLSLQVKPGKVVLLVGTPASGKSTWLEENYSNVNLYVDATFDLPFKRKPWIDGATEAGVPVEVVWLDTPLSVCLDRNCRRPENRIVPEEVLRAMYHKICSAPPTPAEGVSVKVVTPGA
jgi:predicted kinase